MRNRGVSRLIALPDGRTLNVWDGGDPDGVPIVFHHGTPSGRLQAVLGAEAAAHQRVHLVSFDRPGYGSSTDTPPSLASVGRDSVHVANALGLDRLAVLGASGGGPFAIAAALADPERVRAVGVAAGVGPWRTIESPGPDDPDAPHLALADAGDVAGALAGFRKQGHTAFDHMLTLDDDALVDEFFADAPEGDTDWIDAQTRLDWAADSRDALQTYDGYARDNVAWGAAWDIDPTELRVPTLLWYGERDRLVSPAHGHWHAERIAGSTLTIRPGKGHGSTIFEYWDDMFGQLRDLVLR